jgi:hypothetical protein
MSNERNPHKHAELIKAWADGNPIQFKGEDDAEWRDTAEPSWFDVLQYRVKPEPVKVRYRVSLHERRDGGLFTLTSDDNKEAEGHERERDFRRWLADWKEESVEVPQ